MTHVGYNSKVGFDLDSQDPKILKFFEKVKLGQLCKGKHDESFSQARVKEKDLEDENTREAIFEFLEKHPGGVDGAISDVEKDTKANQAKEAKEAFIDWIGEDLLSSPKPTETKEKDCGKVWKNIKSYLSWGGSTGAPSKLTNNAGQLITSPAEMAELQNKYYVEKVKKI